MLLKSVLAWDVQISIFLGQNTSAGGNTGLIISKRGGIMSEVTFGLIAMSLILLPFVILFCVAMRRGRARKFVNEGVYVLNSGHDDGKAHSSDPHFIDTIDR